MQARLQSVTLPEGARLAGRRLGDLALPAMGVHVLSVRRAAGGVVAADDALVLVIRYLGQRP